MSRTFNQQERPSHTRIGGGTVIAVTVRIADTVQADTGSQTRELRITRGAATLSVMLMSALIGTGVWAGWELGHWSAKDTSLTQRALTSSALVAAQDERSLEQDIAR